ncbi:MAG: hypothetical protein VX589_14795 [Myxococcota bacterium]|nr:hypothetical protein [Myxococcota bacterium]
MSTWCGVIDHRWPGSFQDEAFIDYLIDGCLPFIELAQQLGRAYGQVPLTYCLSPRLLDGLTRKAVRARLVRRFEARARCLESLLDSVDIEARSILRDDLNRLSRLRGVFEGCDGHLIRAYRTLHDEYALALITAPAHHVQLPTLMAMPGAVQAQIGLAVRLFEAYLGFAPDGIHLVGAGFTPSLEPILATYGLSFMVIDPHAFQSGSATTVFDVYAPIQTPNHRIVAFAPDAQSAFAGQGSPSLHAEYRRMASHGHRLAVQADEMVVGLSSYGASDGPSERYCPQRAQDSIRRHARAYVHDRQRHGQALESQMTQSPVFVADFRLAELAENWLEAPRFFAEVIHQIQGCAGVNALPVAETLNERIGQQVMWPGPVVHDHGHDRWAPLRWPRLFQGFAHLHRSMKRSDLSEAQLDALTIAARHLFAALDLPSSQPRDSHRQHAQLIRMCQHVQYAIEVLRGSVDQRPGTNPNDAVNPPDFDDFGGDYLIRFDARTLLSQ